jgi:Kef-type K+ transport system membrane component KefB
MNTIFSLLAIVLVAFMLSKVFKKVKLSSTIYLIFLGLAFSIPFIQNIFFQWNTVVWVDRLSHLGLISLMFIAWIGSSLKKMKKEENTSLRVSLTGLLFTTILLFGLFYILWFSSAVSLLVAICLSISAEWATAQILLEKKKINTKVGTVMLESWIIDDIIWLVLFVVVSLFLDQIHMQEVVITLASLLAFFAWSILKKTKWRHHKTILNIESILNIFIIPFFFISIWLAFSIQSLFISPWILLIMIFWAIAGKLIWTQLSRPFVKDLSAHQLHLVGRAMNSRGAIWLAVAIIVFNTWLISTQLYSAIVVTTLFTTIIFPFIINWYLKKYPKIMS